MRGNKKLSSSVMAAAFLASVAAPTVASAQQVTVKSGDTLSQIAIDNQTTVADLVQTNQIKNPNLIYPGQKVETSAAAAPNTQTQTQQTSTRQVTLQQGDSLWTIAQQYGVSVQALAQANGLSSIYALIHPGQTLTIPDNSQAAATQVNTTAPAAEQTSVTQAPVVQQQSAQTTPAAPATQSTQTAAQSGQDQGTFKLSFYDPAVLGSNMGYGGVAANLSVFPKGTRLKITLSDGTVWYRTVNDTGTFAYSNSRQLDVAMPNAQIPSAGIMYANVQVLS